MGVKGLFHSAELPNYGITQKEKELILKKLKCTSKDGFIIITDIKSVALRAMEAAISRASNFNLIKCVRNARPDGAS